ncbi:MAG: histidine phosphatase family protein [Acidobacteria bacterium]|nr:MAG: histidine phosphatase family protein [Acidobacteriota bacterium]
MKPYNETMPLLMLMRHGKSNWDGSWTTDHERPLAPRGQRAATRMGRFLTDTGHQPMVVISSTAERAAATAHLAIESGRWDCKVTLTRQLYDQGPEGVLEIVRNLDSTVKSTLVVGHNPTWTEITSLLVGGANLRFPTAAIACLEIEGGWSDVRPSNAILRWFVTPHLLETLS